MSPRVPKLIICLREGYGWPRLLRDLLAGATVAVIALPLAMAFGIASIPESAAAELAAIDPRLTPPAVGLATAIVAGFLISALGGSRVQIGGPTGAFIVIVYRIAAEHGYAGLVTATAMAGVILIVMGLARLGTMIKFIPYPVTTGFTAGIAVVIATGQVKDLFGIRLVAESGEALPLPPDFVPRVEALAQHAGTAQGATMAVGLASLAALFVLRRFLPRIPGALLVVVAAAAATALLGLDVETIGSRFGGLPRSIPAPHLPAFSPALVRELIPEATTIALLGAIESLLSAVVADGMIGSRHRSDVELVGQGVANLAVACCWGIPATGAIARTVANVRAGGTSPVAGIVHAIGLAAIVVAAAPLAAMIPLSALAAILVVVAWNMSELNHFRALLRAPRSDVAVLLTTFGLTVFADLTIAVGVGMVLASLLFMRRMTEVTSVRPIEDSGDDDEERPGAVDIRTLPPGIELYEIEGPFFFGTADRLRDVLDSMERAPRAFILRLRSVPAIDATGIHALEELAEKCRRRGTLLVLSGVGTQPRTALDRSGLADRIGRENILPDFPAALERARSVAESGGETAG